jgi:hypothetical protein
MEINLIFDAAAEANTAAAAAFRATMEEAASILDSTFIDNITVNINIDYSGTGGGAAAGPDNGEFLSYSTVYNYLIGTASPGDSSFDSLPVPGSANAPTEVAVWNSQLKAMSAAGYLTPGMAGYISPTSTSTDDGSATFATDIQSNLLLGVALHELTHAMGRVPYSDPDVMELDRFSGAGTRVYDGNVPAGEASYFSINGGKTEWAQYGINSDPSDFLNAANYGGDGTSPLTSNDPFDQYYTGSTLQYLTPVDLELMDTLGFHLKEDAPAEDAYDFNGSNSGDILLHNASGQIEYVNMAGGSDQGLPVNVANVPGWTVVGEGKISGGVDSDIVIQNGSQIAYVDLVNGSFSKFVSIGNPSGYAVVGVGDITDDHYADVVIQNTTTDEVGYANMDNGVFNNWVSIADPVGWKAVAVADITGDGYADVVIQNTTTGEVGYANMDNGVLNGFVSLGEPEGYDVVGAGDINGLGDADVVVQNPTTDAIGYANMVNGVVQDWVSVGDPTGWNVIGVEDVLGNGFDDIVIQNSTTGEIDYADMTPGATTLWVSITSAPAGFTGTTGPAPTGSSASSATASAAVFADSSGQNDFFSTSDQGLLNSSDTVAFFSPQGQSNSDDLPPVGTQIHEPMFGAGLDGNSSSGGGGFAGDTSTSPNLPIGVWEATRYAGNSNNNGASGSFADNSGSGQGSSNSDDNTLTAFGAPNQSNSGNLPPVGTQIHEPMFGAWLDGNSSSDGPNLPIGVFEAVRYANSSVATASGAMDPGTQDNGGGAQYMLGSQNPAAPNGFGGAADFLNNQSGAQGGASLTPASWLTEGARNCSTPTNGAAQVPGTSGFSNNPTPIVTADNLQNMLHLGSSR